MDCSISQEKEDLVDHTLLHSCLHAHLELSEEWCEIGRTSEANLRECLSVSCKNVLDCEHLRVCWVSVHGEAVIDTVDTHVSWDTTESEEREHLVAIIRLNDLADLPNRSFVLVIRTEIMERRRRGWVTVGSSVVNSSYDRYLPA